MHVYDSAVHHRLDAQGVTLDQINRKLGRICTLLEKLVENTAPKVDIRVDLDAVFPMED